MIRRAQFRTVVIAAPLLVAAVACGGGDDPTEDVRAARCVVRLHGKGEAGAPPTVEGDGVAVLSPDGNGTGWGGRQWVYDTDAGVEAATGLVTAAVDEAACERVVVHGFSNGASMAAALLCTGEQLDGRLAGVIVDDPVTDAATEGCVSPEVPVAIYWTGSLDETAPPGTRCDSLDWTCDGGVVRGIDAYAAHIGAEVTPSPYDNHRWYVDSPLPLTWLG